MILMPFTNAEERPHNLVEGLSKAIARRARSAAWLGNEAVLLAGKPSHKEPEIVIVECVCEHDDASLNSLRKRKTSMVV